MDGHDLDELSVCRAKIDNLNEELLNLLCLRFEVIKKVSLLKEAHKIEVMQPNRVAEIIDFARKYFSNRGFDPDLIAPIFVRIIEQSCVLEERMMSPSEARQ